MSVNTYLPPSPVTPPALIITGMTNSYPMIVTVAAANNYVVGQLCHFNIPNPWGMIEMDQQTAQIIAISGLNFAMDIDSTQFNTFTTPASYQEAPASLASAGSRNLYNTQYVPFHSVNGNVGN